MKPKHFCSAALCCILILLSACNKDDNDNPLWAVYVIWGWKAETVTTHWK